MLHLRNQFRNCILSQAKLKDFRIIFRFHKNGANAILCLGAHFSSTKMLKQSDVKS